MKTFLNTVNGGRTIRRYRKNEKIFSQGEPSFTFRKAESRSAPFPKSARKRWSSFTARGTSLARGV